MGTIQHTANLRAQETDLTGCCSTPQEGIATHLRALRIERVAIRIMEIGPDTNQLAADLRTQKATLPCGCCLVQQHATGNYQSLCFERRPVFIAQCCPGA